MNRISSHSVWWRIHRKFHPKKVQTNPNPMGKNKIHHPNLTNLGNLIRFKQELFVKPLQSPLERSTGYLPCHRPLGLGKSTDVHFVQLVVVQQRTCECILQKYLRFQKILRLWSHCFWQKARKDVRSYGMMRYFTQKSTCANGGLDDDFPWFSFSVGWCSSSILMFRGVSLLIEDKASISHFHFTLVKGLHFFFGQIQWSFLCENCQLLQWDFPLADMPLFLPSLVSHQGFQQSCAWVPPRSARVPYVM